MDHQRLQNLQEAEGMKQRSRALQWVTLLGCLLISVILIPAAWAQQTQGTVSVTVMDPSGGVIPGAQLKLVDLSTNYVRDAVTQDAGNYTFVNLNIGSYKLTVSKEGFDTQAYDIVVHAAQTTGLKATLKVGSTSAVVNVEAATPLVETTSSAQNTTIDMKQIEDLPLSGRNLSNMSHLTAGYNGTFNGLPTTAQSSSIDGVIGASGRWKYYAGADQSSVTPRVESIAEMVVSSNQLDMNSGFGTSDMTITYVTRRGTNNFHGRLFEDFRNDALNAKGWNQTKKSKLRLNEFGGAIGGPIKKDKLFFFFSYSMSKQPKSFDVTNAYFLPDAQNGIYKWQDANGVHSVNVFDAVSAYNAANGTSFPTTLNPVVQQQMSKISGLLSQGTIQPSFTQDDPNISGLLWRQNNPITYYYPTLRIDYNLSQKHRLNFAYNQTRQDSMNAYAGYWPGDGKTGSYKSDNFTASVGLDSTLTPTLLNQFKIGYLFSSAAYVTADQSYFDQNAEFDNWGYSGYYMSGQNYFLPTSRIQPVVNIKDDATWVKGKHTFGFGFSAYRDQNTYWDALTGIPTYNLGIDYTDPINDVLSPASLGVPDTEIGGARQLYAVLTGRVSWVNGQYTYNPATGAYSSKGQPVYNKLNELMKAWGVSAQDSFKVLRNLTLNYGLRWDFTGPDRDRFGKYHSLSPADMFGPSGVWNLFNPGSLKGIDNPVATAKQDAYHSWNVAPQPAIGIAWSPRSAGSFIERLLGGDKTVIRTGYSIRRFTEPQQFVWDAASNYSMGLFQDFWAGPGPNPGVGVFTPGSVVLGDALPNVATSPSEYAKVIPMDQYTFSGAAYAGIDPNIRQPYVQSWNFGIQRELGRDRALEVRYVGNRTVHQWVAQNINEANVFENGFLDEFKHAQANLAANGGTSFAPGEAGYALPIMTAAGVSFTDPNFISDLQHGAVGAFAGTLSQSNYFCNMVGASFGPCANYGYTGPNQGYPINFFVANPYAIGSWMSKYTDDHGYSTYNSLQVELRQRNWHGLTATANYTWSKTLGMASAGDWTGSYTQFTLRNNHSSYAPAGTDLEQVVHVNATYDLPFGRGKAFLNNNGLVDKVLGGWTVATIVTFQTGAPFRIAGLYDTFNDQADGGVVLNGVSASDIQKHVGAYFVPSTTGASYSTVYWLDPQYAKSLITDGKITSNQTPGTIGDLLYLHGPHQTFTDVSLSKAFPIRENVRFKFQAEMLNAFNHPVFRYSNGYIGNAATFGRGSYSGTPRNIEFRANIEF
jgi:hypothetical protein